MDDKGKDALNVAIDCLTAKWELELTNARLIVVANDRITHVYKATSDLLDNVRAVSSSETEEFFSSMQFPRTDQIKHQ